MLEYSMTAKLLIEQHLEFLCLKRGCTGSSESTLVKKTHCWKSHAMAHLLKQAANAQASVFISAVSLAVSALSVCFSGKCVLECIWIYAADKISKSHFQDKNIAWIRK